MVSRNRGAANAYSLAIFAVASQIGLGLGGPLKPKPDRPGVPSLNVLVCNLARALAYLEEKLPWGPVVACPGFPVFTLC
jgi:hypothetical protein